MINDKILLELFKLAQKSLNKKEFPVSAIIFQNDKIISKAYNKRNKTNKTTDHAEIIAIEKANKKLRKWKLQEYSMIVTLEPCEMCKNVIKEARIDNIFYIIPRYQYKKQYKGTNFIYFQYENEMKKQYIQNIKHFFDTKR